MESTEKWLPVVGYEGIYEVSDHGRVRSLGRHIGGGRTLIGRVRKLVRNEFDGYLQVNLSVDAHATTRKVHILVARAFHGPRPDGFVVRHLNGVKLDNRAENLRWGTPSENNADTVRHGQHWQANKTHCKKGHPLEHPNLVPGELNRKRGAGRSCLTCYKAYNEAKSARRRAERAAARLERERSQRE